MTADEAKTELYEECLRFYHSFFDITKDVRWLAGPQGQVAIRLPKERMEALLKAIDECRKARV